MGAMPGGSRGPLFPSMAPSSQRELLQVAPDCIPAAYTYRYAYTIQQGSKKEVPMDGGVGKDRINGVGTIGKCKYNRKK